MDDHFQLYDLHVEVVSTDRPYVCGHHTGQGFDVIGENIVFAEAGHFSLYALSALLPLLPAKQRITAANDWMSTDAFIACPDPHCGAQFKISRLRLHTFRHSECTVVPLTATPLQEQQNG